MTTTTTTMMTTTRRTTVLPAGLMYATYSIPPSSGRNRNTESGRERETNSAIQKQRKERKERERDKKMASKRKREKAYENRSVYVHTACTHKIDKKKREKEGCLFARYSIVRNSFLRASTQAQMAMYVSR